MADAHREPKDAEEPLLSSLLAENPELWAVVERFVRELPNRIEAIQSALRAGAFEQVRSMAHDLGEIGADHGYESLLQQASGIEQAAVDAVVDQLRDKLNEMTEMVGRIQAGLHIPEA